MIRVRDLRKTFRVPERDFVAVASRPGEDPSVTYVTLVRRDPSVRP